MTTSPVILEDLNPCSWTVKVMTILLLITHNYLPISISPCSGVIVIKESKNLLTEHRCYSCSLRLIS